MVCNEGYASTLAAVSLQNLGLRNATDLDGGYRACARPASRSPFELAVPRDAAENPTDVD